jgi:hypothetical protein
MCTLSHVVFDDKAFAFRTKARETALWAAISLATDCDKLPFLEAPMAVEPRDGGYSTMWSMSLPADDVRVTIVAATPDGYIAMYDKNTGFTAATHVDQAKALAEFALTATVSGSRVVLVDHVIDRGLSVAALTNSTAKVERSVSAFLQEQGLDADAFWTRAVRAVFMRTHVDSIPADKGFSFDVLVSPEAGSGPMRLSRERGVDVFMLENGCYGGRVRIVAHKEA